MNGYLNHLVSMNSATFMDASDVTAPTAPVVLCNASIAPVIRHFLRDTTTTGRPTAIRLELELEHVA